MSARGEVYDSRYGVVANRRTNQVFVSDIAEDECAQSEIFAQPACSVIEDDYVQTCPVKKSGGVCPYEARSSGYQNGHWRLARIDPVAEPAVSENYIRAVPGTRRPARGAPLPELL
jgi:hypothetical protein